MRDTTIALSFSVTLTIALFLVARPFLGPDTAQVIAGALASGPFAAEYLKRRRIRSTISSSKIDIYRESGFSWRVTVTYGVLLMVGCISIVSFVVSLMQRTYFSLLNVSNPLLEAYTIAGGSLPALMILYFQIGKLFALCRNQRWTALLAVILLGPLTLRVTDFLLIPQSFFDASFPWAERTWTHFLTFMFWTVLLFAIPVSLGAWWYTRREIRVRVSSMMRLLPKETQATIAELVHEEVRSGAAARAEKSSGPEDR